MFLCLKFKLSKYFFKYDLAKDSSLHLTIAPYKLFFGALFFHFCYLFPEEALFSTCFANLFQALSVVQCT